MSDSRMTTQQTQRGIQSAIDEFLTTQPGSPGAAQLWNNATNLRQQYPALQALFPHELPDPTAAPPKTRGFGIFNRQDSTRVAELVAGFGQLAAGIDATGTDNVDRLDLVVKAAQVAVVTDGLELAQYALKSFIVNHNVERLATLPTFVQHHQNLLRRDPQRQLFNASDGPNESDLNWFREDTFLSEHHDHWHLIYSEKQNDAVIKDRRGELFLYMHQQMLARYDTERLAAGLPLVESFPKQSFHEPIDEGYDPGLAGFPARCPKQKIADAPGRPVDDLDKWRDELTKAIVAGSFITADGSIKTIDEDLLGNTIDPKGLSADEHRYGYIHDIVHTMIASIPTGEDSGVMGAPHHSPSDPVFYRWHRFIDDLSFTFQELQAPQNISDDAPDVLIRSSTSEPSNCSQSPDIILCLQKQIDDARLAGESDEAVGERLFGGSHWPEDFSAKSSVTTDELYTSMDTVDFQLPEDGKSVPIRFLNQQEEFVYFLRVQNRAATAQTVTVRIWLVAKYDQRGEPLYENRRMWIEMDTFQVALPANARKVICRPAYCASVVRKSSGVAVKPRALLLGQDLHTQAKGENAYCECGWPYSLLLPKGTATGMTFRLMVMFTTNDVNMQGIDSSCGSVSLCGSRGNRYPDMRRMGYPFNRCLPDNKSIEEVIVAQPTMAARDIQIKHQEAKETSDMHFIPQVLIAANAWGAGMPPRNDANDVDGSRQLFSAPEEIQKPYVHLRKLLSQDDSYKIVCLQLELLEAMLQSLNGMLAATPLPDDWHKEAEKYKTDPDTATIEIVSCYLLERLIARGKCEDWEDRIDRYA